MWRFLVPRLSRICVKLPLQIFEEKNSSFHFFIFLLFCFWSPVEGVIGDLFKQFRQLVS